MPTVDLFDLLDRIFSGVVYFIIIYLSVARALRHPTTGIAAG